MIKVFKDYDEYKAVKQQLEPEMKFVFYKFQPHMISPQTLYITYRNTNGNIADKGQQ